MSYWKKLGLSIVFLGAVSVPYSLNAQEEQKKPEPGQQEKPQDTPVPTPDSSETDLKAMQEAAEKLKERKEQDKPEVEPVGDAYVRRPGSNLWLPAHLFEDSHARIGAGSGLDEGGAGGLFELRAKGDSFDFYMKTHLDAFERLIGTTTQENKIGSGTIGVSNGNLRLRANVVQGEVTLEEAINRVTNPSPTLTQTTTGTNTTEIITDLYSGHLQYEAGPNLVVEASAFDLRVIDKFTGNQTDSTVGQTFVPGAGWIPVNTVVTTDTRTKTINNLEGFMLGAEYMIANDSFLGLKAIYGDNDIVTKVNGVDVMDQNNDFWRFLMSGDSKGVFFNIGYLLQQNDDLDSQVVGTGGAVFSVGQNMRLAPAFTRNDNGKFEMTSFLSFREDPFTSSRRLVDLHRRYIDNRTDLTLTPEQRTLARIESLEDYVRQSESFTIGNSIERIGEQNRYGVHGGAPLTALDMVIAGEAKFGRDYKSFTGGPAFKMPLIGGTVHVLAEYLSDKSADIRDKRVWVAYTIPLESSKRKPLRRP